MALTVNVNGPVYGTTDRTEQMAVFIQLYRRSNVLAVDRANQLADVHANDPPAA